MGQGGGRGHLAVSFQFCDAEHLAPIASVGVGEAMRRAIPLPRAADMSSDGANVVAVAAVTNNNIFVVPLQVTTLGDVLGKYG